MTEIPAVFRGVSSLPDDYDFTMTECRFGRDPQYMNGEFVVFLTDMKTDNSEYGDNGTIHQLLSIGKGWETEDGGAKVVHSTGKERGFNSSSNFQAFVDRCMELDADTMVKHYEETGFSPQDARFWEGLSGHMNRELVTTRFGGKEEQKEKELPTSLSGWGGGKPAKKAAAKKAAAKKVAAKPETNGDEPSVGAAKAAIKLIANEIVAADIKAETDEWSVNTFIERAYGEVAGIDESNEIQALVTNYEEEDSIWQEAIAAASAE